MTDAQIEVLKVEISRLDVRHGECLLVRIPEAHMDHANLISENIRRALPAGVCVLLAPLNVEFSVVPQPE